MLINLHPDARTLSVHFYCFYEHMNLTSKYPWEIRPEIEQLTQTRQNWTLGKRWGRRGGVHNSLFIRRQYDIQNENLSCYLWVKTQRPSPVLKIYVTHTHTERSSKIKTQRALTMKKKDGCFGSTPNAFLCLALNTPFISEIWDTKHRHSGT